MSKEERGSGKQAKNDCDYGVGQKSRRVGRRAHSETFSLLLLLNLALYGVKVILVTCESRAN